MGGDHAPHAPVAGALLALAELGSDHSVTLVGRSQVIEDELHRLEAQQFDGFDASTNLAFLIFKQALLNFDAGVASAGALVAVVLANIVAAEMGAQIRTTSGPAIERAGDLAAVLTALNKGVRGMLTPAGGFAMRSKVAFMSADVKSVPSWN